MNLLSIFASCLFLCFVSVPFVAVAALPVRLHAVMGPSSARP
jgi:hypothetical protein